MRMLVIALIVAGLAMHSPVRAQPAVEAAPAAETGWTFFDYLGVGALVIGGLVVADVITGGALSGPLYRSLAWAGEASGIDAMLARSGGSAAGAAAASEGVAAPGAIRIHGVVSQEAAEAIVVNGQKIPCTRITVCGAAHPMMGGSGVGPIAAGPGSGVRPMRYMMQRPNRPAWQRPVMAAPGS